MKYKKIPIRKLEVCVGGAYAFGNVLCAAYNGYKGAYKMMWFNFAVFIFMGYVFYRTGKKIDIKGWYTNASD